MKKIRVAVLYGGRSGEHEVSLRSAASVIRNLDPTRFEAVPIGIDKNGKWHLAPPQVLLTAQSLPEIPVYKESLEVGLPANPSASQSGLVPVPSGPNAVVSGGASKFDVVFPIIHGTNGEDGTIQGLFELAEVAYVGCGVLGSAIGMDKEVAKRLVKAAGAPVVPYIPLKKAEWQKARGTITDRVTRELGIPCFVKPVNAGSSVGVHKVKKSEDLIAAIEDAFRYDVKVLIEKAIPAREIEFSALENPKFGEEPLISIAGEINPTHEFYSYEAKYLDENGATMKIPADLTPVQLKTAQAIARTAFTALECEGMARVDMFLDKNTGEFYFNEVNTLPGFTSISMYPKMWEASGLKYSDLLTTLIELALARHERKKALVRDFKVPKGE